MSQKLLVVGAGGMLGTDLVAFAQTRGWEIVAAAGRRDLDITDRIACREYVAAHRPDFVVNCAAWTQVDAAEDHPDDAWRINQMGAQHLAQACAERQAWCVQISSDFVFDGEKGAPYVETDQPNPLSIYGASKLGGEREVRRWQPDAHMIVRTGYVYGPQGNNIVESILRLAQSRPELRFVTDQIVTPTHTAVLVSTLLDLIAAPVTGTYHVSAADSCSLFDFAQAVVSAAGLSTPILPITFAEYLAAAKPKARRPRYSALACPALRLRGFPELPVWQVALADYLARRQA